MAREAAKMMTPISDSKKQRLSCRPRSSAGFTLLEIILVLTLIGMASVLIFPNVGNLDARTFSVQVRQASSLLNFARRDAVVRGQPSTVRFYGQEQEADAQAPASLNLVANWESDGIDLSFLDSTDQQSTVDESLDVTFYPEGGSTGGTLVLAYEQQLVHIVIDPFSGRVSSENPDE